jgi:hypothetical protein
MYASHRVCASVSEALQYSAYIQRLLYIEYSEPGYPKRCVRVAILDVWQYVQG